MQAAMYQPAKPCNRGHMAPRYESSGHCSECIRIKGAEWRKANPERQAASTAAWAKANPEKVRARSRDWRKRHLEKARENARYYKRLTLPEPTRPEPTNCELCGRNPGRALCLDHCHATNVFRGWLCSTCNSALGFMNDSPSLLRAAAEYLEK